MDLLRVGLAMTASHCTFEKTLRAVEALKDRYVFTPILSERAYATDTRFGTAAALRSRLEELCGRAPLHSVTEVEPGGPGDYFDLLLIAPCTGNTLAKLAAGMTDGCVPMAAKSHLRGGKPVLLALSTNDGLSGSAGSIAALLNWKNVYFLPFYQDDPERKPSSLVSDYRMLDPAIRAAAEGRQIQPLLARV